MSTKLGSAKRARMLASLFEKWRRACGRQDVEAMAAAKRMIDRFNKGASLVERGKKRS